MSNSVEEPRRRLLPNTTPHSAGITIQVLEIADFRYILLFFFFEKYKKKRKRIVEHVQKDFFFFFFFFST
jgi:hypothetical protein